VLISFYPLREIYNDYEYLFSLNEQAGIDPDVLGLPLSFQASFFRFFGPVGFLLIVIVYYFLTKLDQRVIRDSQNGKYFLSYAIYLSSALLIVFSFHTSMFGIAKFIAAIFAFLTLKTLFRKAGRA
jgi:hypothetical protein